MEDWDGDDDHVYNDGSDDDVAFDDPSDTEHDIVMNDNGSTLPLEKHYTVLSEADIRHRQNEEISHVSSLLSLSRAEASSLLCHYNWNVSQFHDEWFTNEESVRTKVGLVSSSASQQSNVSNSNNNTCGICFDDEFSPDQIFSVGCAHKYCITCWRSYIILSINDTGPGCLSLRCPEPKCPIAVGQDVISKVAPEEEKEKYFSYFIRSYVECKKLKTKWCPSPGCCYAVEFELGSSNVYDVTCNCSHAFCFNCAEEPHRPVECKIVTEWIMKNKSEAENTKWIMAYSKPCPKCNRPIEKKQGCNHMTCGPPCRHHFCWMCLRPLRTAGEGAYSCKCNRFRWVGGKEEENDDHERKKAKKDLERYQHYYERWASNHKSREKASADLQEMKTEKLKILQDKVNKPITELLFIIEAWEQIVECRRVLKWTYAYGFFILEHEHSKRQLFEYSQGEAEVVLERLHYCAEMELSNNFLGNGEPTEDFGKFRTKLAGLTKVTGNYFKNLVRDLENGLSEVRSQNAPAQSTKRQKRNKGSTSTSQAVVEFFDDYQENEVDDWSCDRCTFINPGSATSCQACYME